MATFEARLESRRNNFKKGTDADEMRRKREDEALQVRKQKKEEALQQRRRLGNAGMANAENIAPTGAPEQSPLQEAVCKLASSNADEVLAAVQSLRKALSKEVSPPIQECINMGAVPPLVGLMRIKEAPPLQFEAAWALTNIASGCREQTYAVVQYGAVPVFVDLLGSPSSEVVEQAVWALGNIAGDGAELRDQLLQQNIIPALLRIFEHCMNGTYGVSMMRNATWVVSNLARGKPPPPLHLIQGAFPIGCTLLFANDGETVTDTCWFWSYVSDGPDERIFAVLNSGCVPRIVALLMDPQTPVTVKTPALRTIGNIATGDDQATQSVIDMGVLKTIPALLQSTKSTVKKEACWMVSNVTAGTAEQIQVVINEGLITGMVELSKNCDFDVQKEIVWTISNATTGGRPEHIHALVSCGALTTFVNALGCKESKVILVALEGISNILKKTEGRYTTKLEELGGLEALEQLMEDSNMDVYNKAFYIVETFFGIDDTADQAPMDNFGQQAGAAPQAFNFAPEARMG